MRCTLQSKGFDVSQQPLSHFTPLTWHSFKIMKSSTQALLHRVLLHGGTFTKSEEHHL